MSTTAQKRLQYALDSFSTCTSTNPSRFGGEKRLGLTLLLEQLARNRHVEVHQDLDEDEVYPSDILLLVSRTCKHWRRLVEAWLDTKENIKYGGPLCGYHDPERTKFIIDLNMLKLLKPETTFEKFDAALRQSTIKTWGCLDWSPLTWWFEHVFFSDTDEVDWPQIRERWKDPIFQMHPKNIRIDMSKLRLSSPVILLDAILSFLGMLRNINTLEIKVNTLRPEPWPQPSQVDEEERDSMCPLPVVPILAVVWKWQNLCDPWIARDRSAVACCTCCHQRRPRVLYWDVADSAQRSWTQLKLKDDNSYLDHRLLQWTCEERRYWDIRMSQVQDNSRWFNFDEIIMPEKTTKIDDVCFILGDFLLDIDAIRVDTKAEVFEVANKEGDLDVGFEPETAEASEADEDEAMKGAEGDEKVNKVRPEERKGRVAAKDDLVMEVEVQKAPEVTETMENSHTLEDTEDEEMKDAETNEGSKRAGSAETVGTLQTYEDEITDVEIGTVPETRATTRSPATLVGSEDEVMKDVEAEEAPETTEIVEIPDTPNSNNSRKHSLRERKNKKVEAERLPKTPKTPKTSRTPEIPETVDTRDTPNTPETHESRTYGLRKREKSKYDH